MAQGRGEAPLIVEGWARRATLSRRHSFQVMGTKQTSGRDKVLLASGIPRVEVAAMLSIALEGFERELIEDGNAATTRRALGLDGALPAPELGSLR